MIRFLSGKLKKHMKLAKIVKISEIFNRLVFPLNFNRFCHPMTLHPPSGTVKLHNQDSRGRALSSDWSVNSFIVVLYGKIFFEVQSEFSVQRTIKKFSHRQPLKKLLMDQSELNAILAECKRKVVVL